MGKKISVPDGWEIGMPNRKDTGNYYLNASEKKVYFWNGREWCRAIKDVFGELNWHERINKQPDVKCFKLIKHIIIIP